MLLTLSGFAAQARDLKFRAVLVWATNAEKSPNPKHKPVDDEVRRKLKELPLKWSHFFEVNRVSLLVPESGSATARLSEKCQIEVAHVKGDYVEVSLIGKGQPVLKRTLPLPKGALQPLLGGNAPGDTGWLVMLKRLE